MFAHKSEPQEFNFLQITDGNTSEIQCIASNCQLLIEDEKVKRIDSTNLNDKLCSAGAPLRDGSENSRRVRETADQQLRRDQQTPQMVPHA